MNGRLRNERTNENACVCACVQAGEETNITRRGGRRKPSEETRKICKRLIVACTIVIKRKKKKRKTTLCKGEGKRSKKKKPLKALTLTKLTLKKRVYSDIIIAVSAANQLCEWRTIGGLILREIITDDR